MAHHQIKPLISQGGCLWSVHPPPARSRPQQANGDGYQLTYKEIIMFRQTMLKLIAEKEAEREEAKSMQGHHARLQGDQPTASSTGYMALVEAHMKAEGSTKAMAMRAITAKHPEAHEAWIREVNK